MAFRHAPDTAPVAQPAIEAEPVYDVMALRRLTDHPLLAPMVARRQDLVGRLRALEAQHMHLKDARVAMEKSEAESVMALGSAWSPTKLREVKMQLDDLETEAKVVGDGLALLDVQIDETTAQVRTEVEAAFNVLRQPLLDQTITALESAREANKKIHAIEGLSQRLLGFAKYHLYDASLEARLTQMQRSQHLMHLAALGTDAA